MLASEGRQYEQPARPGREGYYDGAIAKKLTIQRRSVDAVCAREYQRAVSVEKGLTSTMEDEIASAATTLEASICPRSNKGTASGMMAPSTPTVDANAETMPPT